MLIAKCWYFLVLLFRSLLCWFISAVHVFATVDEKALEILGRASAYYQELENFSATYNLTIKYPEENIEQYRYDKLCITARGQQYKLSYDQKKTIIKGKATCVYNKETITDGETVWVYDKELKEVTISEYSKTDTDLNFLNFTELYNIYQQEYRPVYIGERIVSKTKNIIRDIIQLTPVHEDSSFKSITIEVDRTTSQIHRWEVVQNEETRYICTVCNFKINIPLSDSDFTFDVGAHGDLEIIDLRESEEVQESESERKGKEEINIDEI